MLDSVLHLDLAEPVSVDLLIPMRPVQLRPYGSSDSDRRAAGELSCGLRRVDVKRCSRLVTRQTKFRETPGLGRAVRRSKSDAHLDGGAPLRLADCRVTEPTLCIRRCRAVS